MQKYEKIKELPFDRFRRLTGISKFVFQSMLGVIRAAEHKCLVKGGRPSYLQAEDKLLMTFQFDCSNL
jgi:hypothetical protein